MHQPNSQRSSLICAPIIETQAEAFLAAIDAATSVADAIELRLDYLRAEEVSTVLDELVKKEVARPLIYTFRPREQGGRRDLSLGERQDFWHALPRRLKETLAYADFELDLVESLIGSEPPLPWAKVICSNHDFDQTPANLRDIYARIARSPAAVVKVATKANRIADCLPIFELVENSEKPIIALAMGLAGISTRVLALSRGALLTFGALRQGAESASGQPTASELRDLYRVGQLSRATEIMGIIGCPVGHTRSPLIHNSVFAATGRDAVYLPFEVEDVASFVRDFVRPSTKRLDWRLRGLSVTIPHKLAIMPHLDFIDPTARAIGAVNTVVVAGDELHGYNTDVIGAMRPLEKLVEIREARVAVIGAGGSARAICYGLIERGANVTIYARDLTKAQKLADEFGARAALLDGFKGDAEVVVNCTPIGMRGHDEGGSPVSAEALRGVRLVYDLIYTPMETQLLQDARAAGCRTLGGMAMLVGQAAEQFRLWTGEVAPIDVMWRAVT